MATTGPMFLDEDLQEREEELEDDGTTNSEQISGETKNFDIEFAKLGRRTLLAAEKGRLLELASLININSSVVSFADDDGYTPLHRASYGGHKDCVKYLLKHGANIEAKTQDDWTPLHCAVRWNNIVVAECLVQQGANINAISNGGNTPLHIAASNGRYSITCDIIQLLLYHPNCDYLIRNSSGDTAYDIAKRSGPLYKFWQGVMTLPDDKPIDSSNSK